MRMILSKTSWSFAKQIAHQHEERCKQTWSGRCADNAFRHANKTHLAPSRRAVKLKGLSLLPSLFKVNVAFMRSEVLLHPRIKSVCNLCINICKVGGVREEETQRAQTSSTHPWEAQTLEEEKNSHRKVSNERKPWRMKLWVHCNLILCLFSGRLVHPTLKQLIKSPEEKQTKTTSFSFGKIKQKKIVQVSRILFYRLDSSAHTLEHQCWVSDKLWNEFHVVELFQRSLRIRLMFCIV